MCTITCTGKIVVQVYLCVQVPLVVTRSIYGRHKCPSCRVVVMLNVHNIMLVSNLPVVTFGIFIFTRPDFDDYQISSELQ